MSALRHPAAEAPVVLTVTPMRRRHLAAVLDIEAAVYPTPWSARLFDDELVRRGRSYVVARVGDQVVGYAGVLMIADDGHIATVAVDPAWQGRGIGRALLAELVRAALEMGANQLTLEVRVSNEAAKALYRRFGFVPAGARKAYYADNGEDALVMWAHDIRGRGFQERLAQAAAPTKLEVVRSGFGGTVGAARPVVHPALEQP
jgi:[ribosomal protein S18]-alanine N-acetyltransferase